MVYFPNEELELYEYVESTTEFNEYYEPERKYYLKEVVPCNFQTMGTNDTLKEFGEVLTDTYKVIIDSDVDVDSSMILKVKGKPETYEIYGTPIKNIHFNPTKHIKLILKKQRKPMEVYI